MTIRRIIVACGSGVATSNIAAARLQELLRERGMEHIEVRAVDVKSLESEAQVADLLVSITPYAQRDQDLPIPVLNGIPLLTGVGIDELIEQIAHIDRS